MTTLAFGPEAPVQICQIEMEFARLLDIYRDMKPRRVLEIGTASGGTLYHWLKAAQPNATVVTVDLPDPEYPLDRLLCHGWAPKGVELVMVSGDSHDPETQLQVMEHAPYDWLFIDGSHEYEQAKADWNDYAAMCAAQAVVAFHDISLERSGVPQLWREIQALGLPTVELRAQPGMVEYGIGMVILP